MEMFLLKLKTSSGMLCLHAIIGLFNPLLESEDVQWGLYEWCSLEEGKATQCHRIHPGESPAYIEVARFSAAFSVVMIILNIPIVLWLPTDKSICKWLLKLVITWLPSLNVGTTLVLVGAYYKDDDRWKDSTPSVTSFFSLIAIFAVLDFVLTCIFFLCFSCILMEVISDLQICQRQGRHSRPPPNAEPISNQGEKNQTLCCQRLNCAKIKASTLWKNWTLCCQRLNCAKIKANIFWKNRTLCCQRLNCAKIKASILWRHLCRKLVTAMKCLKASICGKRLSRKPVMTMKSLKARSSGKHLSRKLVITIESLKARSSGKHLVITMKRLGPGTVQNLPDNPLRHPPGHPEGHGSPPIRHAPGGPAGDLPPGIDQNHASDTLSVRAGHSEGAARYNAADAYRSGDTTIHQTVGQDDVSRSTTMDSVIHPTSGQGEVSRYTTINSVILQDAPPERSGRSAAMDPVIGQGGQEELSRSHSARDAPRVHSICRPQLTLADFHSFVDPQTNRLIFQLRRPGQRGTDPPTSSYI